MVLTDKEADWILTQLDTTALTEWETAFVGSLRVMRSLGSTLTNKQTDVLSRIWDKQGG